jgi:hypothetical protein
MIAAIYILGTFAVLDDSRLGWIKKAACFKLYHSRLDGAADRIRRRDGHASGSVAMQAESEARSRIARVPFVV